METTLHVRESTPADIDGIVAASARAFSDDPLNNWLLGGTPAKRARQLAAFFKRGLWRVRTQRRGELELALERVDAALVSEQSRTGPPPYGKPTKAIGCVVRALVASVRGAWDEGADAALDAVDALREVGAVESQRVVYGRVTR